MLEFFVSTHGARKGLADTALRTADAGYLTRRLVDVAQDVIVRDIDCGTHQRHLRRRDPGGPGASSSTWRDRIKGRTTLEPIVHPETGEVLVRAGDRDQRRARRSRSKALGIKAGRDPLAVLPASCGRGSARSATAGTWRRGELVEVGTAVGIIAAQSIGEPGTQLTMRTFHTGGVAGEYLTGVAEVKKKKQETLKQLHDDIEEGLVSSARKAPSGSG